VLCIIIGEGEYKQYLKKLIINLKLKSFVQLIGSKDHNQLPLWFNSADLFVFPSEKESFGIVIIEALSCGIPVIAAYNGGSEYILTKNELGYLVPPKDPEILSHVIINALNKKWDPLTMRQHVKSFSWNDIVKSVYSLYKKVV